MRVKQTHADIRHVVMDWNGTMIDDLDLAVEGVNHVCARFGVAPVTRETYRRHFRFPISDFYAALGFDLARIPFAEVVREYLSVFDARVRHCPLHEDCIEFLEAMRERGIGLSILSASHRDTLIETVRIKELDGYFSHILGLGDQHATSKLAEARILQDRLQLPPQQVLYVGDTTHDAEIAEALGWSRWTLSCGHQDESQLAACGGAHSSSLREWPARLLASAGPEVAGAEAEPLS